MEVEVDGYGMGRHVADLVIPKAASAPKLIPIARPRARPYNCMDWFW